MLETLVLACMIESSDSIGDNYNFRDYVCSEEFLPKELEDCGFLKDLFDPSKELPKLDFDTLSKLREFYERCCREA